MDIVKHDELNKLIRQGGEKTLTRIAGEYDKSVSYQLLAFKISESSRALNIQISEEFVKLAAKELYKLFYFFTFDEVNSAFDLINHGKIELYNNLNLPKLVQAFELIDEIRTEKAEMSGRRPEPKKVQELSPEVEKLIKDTVEKLSYKDDRAKDRQAWEMYQKNKQRWKHKKND